MKYYLGIDVGSTTVKLYLTDENDKCLFSKYTRHFSDVRKTIYELLIEVKNQMGDIDLYPVMTGSGGLSLADKLGISFIQEVIACTKTVETYIPQTDVVIELGGEEEKALKQAVAGRMGDEELSQEVNDIVNNVNQK